MTNREQENFPQHQAGPGQPPDQQEVGRRDFLKLVGLGTAALATGSAVAAADALKFTPEPEEYPQLGPESRVASLCDLCPQHCGMIVRKISDRAVKVGGNALDPTNQGGLCPVGQAILQLVYSPDRVRAPLKRLGERGQGQWQAISWPQALELIKSRLDQLRSGPGAHTLAVLSGGNSELADRLMARLLQAYGSPNFLLEDTAAASQGQHLTQGIAGRVAYDFENSEYILSFGAPLMEAWMSPVRQMRAIGEFREGWFGRRGKLVQVESRLSATAARADEWIAVNPGTEGMLALGIANVLVDYGLYDTAFVREYVAGFDRWVGRQSDSDGGFRKLLLENYKPSAVAEITGVPVGVIVRLAREFSRLKAAVAVPGVPRYGTSNPVFAALAVQALNALAGNIDRPGGVMVCPEPPLAPWPAVKPQEPARAAGQPALRSPADLARAAWEETPYRVNALFLLGANPLFSSLELRPETLARIPFVVSFTPLLDETAANADLVLPDCSSLERWELRTRTPGLALNSVGVARPAVAAQYGSRPAAQVVIDLARSLGGAVAASMPWGDPGEAARQLLAGLQAWPHGEVYTEHFLKQYLRPEMRAWNWPAPIKDSLEEFTDFVIERGGWVDPRYTYGDYRNSLRTESGKFELPRLLKSDASSSSFTGSASQYPLALHLFQPLALMSRVSANLPYLQEISGSPEVWVWDSFAEINPATAAALGIRDGDWVLVQSAAAQFKIRARLYAGAMPNVVNLPLGQGHTALGRWARRRGANPLDLLANGAAPRVRVSKS